MKKLMLPLGEEFYFLCPYHVDNLVRLGCNGDGGYIVPQHLIDCTQELLSFGIGTDWSFEQDFLNHKPSIPIHMYDTGPEASRLSLHQQQQFAKFIQPPVEHFKKFVGVGEDKIAFSTAISNLDTDNIFVKMDVEGDEYECITDMLASHHRIIGLAIEFHNCWADGPRFKHAIHSLQDHYDIVHVHGCNNDCVSPDNQPNVMEITFIRQDLLSARVFRPFFYLEDLDYPVNKNLPEHYMFIPDYFAQIV